MDFQQRKDLVNSVNSGNHIAQDAPTYHAETIIVVECPTCGDLAPEGDIKATGECKTCVEDFYRKNYASGKQITS